MASTFSCSFLCGSCVSCLVFLKAETHEPHEKEHEVRKAFYLRKSKMSLPCQPNPGELPPQMRVEKIPVCFPAVARRCHHRCTAKYHLVDHELTVIFADRSTGLLKTGICEVSRVRPFPSKTPI